MTEEQKQLMKIVRRRVTFMNKTWEFTECNFDFKTFVEVSFINNDDDFRTTKYPTIDIAIEQQTIKLKRDVRASVDPGKDIGLLIDALLA